ncbi:hypothetical protein AB0M54_04915 [Actinoplanes sp. NPDC051470]|uniref:hypothetical protein n=1 Tax=Actinoplanes sp. NPDC051470 TaxID=3157224 RepID=UPI0034465374
MRKPSVSGRGWAYIGAALGGSVSIAANVAHSYVPPADGSADWTPQTGAVIGSVFWPIALFVATEILARVAWPTGRRWTALRFLGLLPVALVAAIVSYRHGSGLLRFYGEDVLTAHLGPVAVDGLMVMASAALLATARRTAPLAERVEPAESSAPKPVAAPVNSAEKTPTKRVTPRPASAVKVAKVAAKMPGAPVAQIAAKAGVSESTARRYLPVPAATVASPSAPVPAETPALAAA